MAEMNVNTAKRRFMARHRGRGAQVFIYLGKLLRMFIYQNDWKVLPMAALIAGLVGMVIRKKFFINMEGTVMGAFAMVCVCIWNGCFNSIQVICRERDVIKREHRSGMHISSYIVAHMLYQALLCVLQVGVTLFVTSRVGVRYPAEGVISKWFIVDFGISMFLITYASDMMSLWVSSLSHTTTTAMTIMPFVLIFQLVFSGGMLSLPAWTKPLTNFTISNPGLKVVACQADVNHRPYATIADLIKKMRDNEIGGTVTLGQVLDLLDDRDNATVAEIRSKQIGKVFTLGEVTDMLEQSKSFNKFRQETIIEGKTVGDLLNFLLEDESMKAFRDYEIPNTGIKVGTVLGDVVKLDDFKPVLEQKLTQLVTVGDVVDTVKSSGLLDAYRDVTINAATTVGEIADWLTSNEDIQAHRDDAFTLKTTLGKILDVVGEKNVMNFLEEKAAAANYKPEYECTPENIAKYWTHLFVFILAFAILATVTLEFIDKDKR